MNYEIVELKEKTIVGFSARTSNNNPKMQSTIARLWEMLYDSKNVTAITNRTNQFAIGLYSDYENGAMGEYDVTAGFEVSEALVVEGAVVKVIPAGRYAKFSIKGDAMKKVGETWGEIWSTPLKRTFTGDFEEYVSMEDVDIYIAIE